MTITISTTDKGEARLLLNAARYKGVLWEFDQWLRARIKYEDKPWQDVRDELYRLMGEEGIDLEDDYEPTEESGCACGRAEAADGNGADGDDGPAPVAGRR